MHEAISGGLLIREESKKAIHFDLVNVETQPNTYDCVVYAIANATELAYSLDPALCLWVWPAHPWQRVHSDFAGPFMNRMFLVVIDAHSKWPKVVEMTTITTQNTIQEVRKLFLSYRLPQQVVTNNGPQFVSEEFRQFMKQNDIKHIKVPPYHPSSNRAAECLVQTFRKAMKASSDTSHNTQY